MKKVNFSKIEIKNLAGEVIGDFPVEDFANAIYNSPNKQSLAASSLAHKLYDAKGKDIEINEKEIALIFESADMVGLVPAAVDALNEALR